MFFYAVHSKYYRPPCLFVKYNLFKQFMSIIFLHYLRTPHKLFPFNFCLYFHHVKQFHQEGRHDVNSELKMIPA